MKVLLISIGSRGDLEPFLSLSRELLLRRHHHNHHHQVHLFLQPNWKSLITKDLISNSNFHLHFLPFTNGDFYHVTPNNSPPPHSDPRMTHLATLADIIGELALPCLEQVKQVAQGCDMLVTCAMARPLIFLLSQLLNIPAMLLHLQPLLPNRQFPNYRTSSVQFVHAIQNENLPADNHQEMNNNLEYEESYWKLEHAMEYHYLKDRLAAAYSSVGCNCPPTWKQLQETLQGHNPGISIVNGFSNELVPPLLYNDINSGLGPNVVEVGALADKYIPSDFCAPPSLERFLLDDEKPIICIGFGSMPVKHPHEIFKSILILNQRTVLVGGPLRPPASNQRDLDLQRLRHLVYWIPSIPYPWLLPKVSLMLCHGGAGVVHACLAAGIPCLVCPLMGDQTAWAGLLQAKGYGMRCGASRLSELKSQEIVECIQSAQKNAGLIEKCKRLRLNGLKDEEEQSTGALRLVDFMEKKAETLLE